MRTLLFQGYLWGYIFSKVNKTFTIKKLNKAGKTKEKLELINKLILKCIKKLVKISGADITVTGTENVPIDEPVLYVGNHQCNMDIPLNLIVPAFFEAGRFTIDNIHYLAEGENLVPVSDTEFSRDAVFGFSTSYLPDWINEKTEGKVPAEKVIVISIEDIRNGGVEMVVQKLLRAEHYTPIIVNAAAYEDLDLVSLAVLQAIGMGKQFLFRTAASFVKSLGGILDRPYLTAAELQTAQEQEKYGGLIMVGSHTKKQQNKLKH